MSKFTQGTQVYFIDPATEEVVVIECATSFNPGGNPADQIEDTCLENKARTYRKGLRTPGTATIGLNADPENASHLRLYALSKDDAEDNIQFAVGWSDGESVPTVATDSEGALIFDFPDDRTWFPFEGYVSDFPFDFQLNTVVTSEVSVQRSGESDWIPKVAS